MKKLLLLFLLLPAAAWGTIDSTGQTLPSAADGVGWTNPSNALTSNNSRATDACLNTNTQKWTVAPTFPTAVATIDSIILRVEYRQANCLGCGGSSAGVLAAASWDGGTSWGSNVSLNTTSASDVILRAGDLSGGGHVWAQEEIESNFRVRLTENGDCDSEVDAMWVGVYYTVDTTGSDIGSQLPTPCNITTGDTLYPVGTGTANALSNGCGLSQANNWQCVDETPGASGCDAGTDSVYMNSTTAQIDYYKLGTRAHDPFSSTRWGQLDSADRIIDCIGVTGCFQKTGGSSVSVEVCLGLRDSAGNEYWGSMYSTTLNNTNYTVTSYFPNTTFAGSTRWDSTSLLGLEVAVRLRVANVNRRLKCKNIYAIVYARKKVTTVPDSTNSDMQTLACSSSTHFDLNRQSGLWQSRHNKNRFWTGVITNAATNQWLLSASNDTGRTWYWLSTTSDGNNTDDFGANLPDTVTIRAANDNLLTGDPGIFFFGDSSSTVTSDSFHMASIEEQSLDTAIIYRTEQRQQIQSELTDQLDLLAVPTNGGVGVGTPNFYQLGDTLWAIVGTNITTGRLRWHRSTDNGATWPDSGYIQGPRCGINADTGTIGTTAGVRRVVMVRWSNGYPGVFLCGWRGTGHGNKITFLTWHPSVTNADSMRLHAWFRNDNAEPDTFTVANLGPISNNGELTATSVYNGTSVDTMGHVFWFVSPRLLHASVEPNNTVVIDTVIENQAAGTANMWLTCASLNMKDVYVFWNYLKNGSAVPSSGDTSTILFNRLCTGADNKWNGPRPAGWAYDTSVSQIKPSAAKYQYGNMVTVVFLGSTRNASNLQTLRANRIVKMASEAAGATPTPLRRRRSIIEKNYKTGSLDENDEDSTSGWAGLRLPDWDATEK